MTRHFYRIVAGIGFRSTKQGHQYLVEHHVLVGHKSENRPVRRAVEQGFFLYVFRIKILVHNGNGLWTAEAYDRNGGTAVGGGDGNDGIVEGEVNSFFVGGDLDGAFCGAFCGTKCI